MAGAVRAANGLIPGCRGRSPWQNKLIVSPFPGGEGGRGMGQKSKLKAGRTGDKKGKPPAGAWFAPFPVPRWVQPRGCKGRSPLHEITLGSPFPPGRALCERGSGGWGQKSKLKSGAAGNPKGKPPLWIPEWHGQPATSRASPPPGAPTADRAGNGAAHLLTTVIISCGKCDIFLKIC